MDARQGIEASGTMNVKGPDGQIVPFPDGTPPEVVDAKMRKRYAPQSAQSSMFRKIMLGTGKPKDLKEAVQYGAAPFQPPPWLANLLVPSTQTGRVATGTALAGDILAMANPELGIPAKAALEVAPVLTGALSGFQQGGMAGVLPGAGEAAVMTLPGAGVAAGYGRYLTHDFDAARIATTIAKHMPALQPAIQAVLQGTKKARDVTIVLDRLLRGKEGKEAAGQALKQIKNVIKDTVGDRRFAIPQLVPRDEPFRGLTFEEADNAITNQWNASYNPVSGEKRGSITGAALRAQTHEGRNELIRQLAEIDPQMAEAYRRDRDQMTGAMTLNRIFKKPEVIKGGRVNMEKLQKLIERGNFREALEGLDMGGDFLRAAFREAPPIATDVNPTIGLSAHGGIPPRPRIYAHVVPHTVGQKVRVPRSAAMTLPRWLTEQAMQVIIPNDQAQRVEIPDQGGQ